MKYRVEELAVAAGLTVDTVRFYQGRGLLHPPQRSGRFVLYDESHIERLAQIKGLQGRGFTLAVIARILRGELDAADEALVQAVVSSNEAEGTGPEEFWTLEELGLRAGVTAVLLESLEREGVLVPRRQHGEARYTEADLVALRAGLKLLEYGLPLSDVLDLAREHEQSARLIAERAVTLFDRHIRKAHRGEDGAEAVAELVEAFHALLPTTVALVGHHFRRILLAVAQEHIEAVGDDQEVAAVRSESIRRLEPPMAAEG